MEEIIADPEVGLAAATEWLPEIGDDEASLATQRAVLQATVDSWTSDATTEHGLGYVDPATWELRSHVSELLATGSQSLGDQIKREMHQSIVEVGTPICADVGQLEHSSLQAPAPSSQRRVRLGEAVTSTNRSRA